MLQCVQQSSFGSVEVSGFAWATGGRYADRSTDPFSTLRLVDSTGATRADVVNLSATTMLLAHISSFP